MAAMASASDPRNVDNASAYDVSGCIQRPNTWVRASASLNNPIFPLHRGRHPNVALLVILRQRNNLVGSGKKDTKSCGS